MADAAGEYGDVVQLLAYTGLRYGKLAALQVRRIDLLRRRLTVATVAQCNFAGQASGTLTPSMLADEIGRSRGCTARACATHTCS